jgi:hypothetical protein
MNTHPGQKFYKTIPFSCHSCPFSLLWHKFDNCLCNFLQSKVSCCLHMYFLWRHHLPSDKSESDQDSDSDWFTYCIDIWLPTLLFSLQYLSEPCSGNDNKFLLPNPWVVLFFIHPTLYSLKILFTQLFSLQCHSPPPKKIMTGPYSYIQPALVTSNLNFFLSIFMLKIGHGSWSIKYG